LSARIGFPDHAFRAKHLFHFSFARRVLKRTSRAARPAQFNQHTIPEFQVITTGYKAEFGHASGRVVNATTKSGGNTPHGLASV